MLLPYSLDVKCLCLPELIAGKMEAVLIRNWKQQVKAEIGSTREGMSVRACNVSRMNAQLGWHHRCGKGVNQRSLSPIPWRDADADWQDS